MVPGFFLILGPGLVLAHSEGGPKKAYVPGAAKFFLIVLIQTRRKNANCACARWEPPKKKVLVARTPRVLKTS
jgi:hypothetical protein